MSNYPGFTQELPSVDGAEMGIFFQLATNGVVCTTAVNDQLVIMTSAGLFNR